MTKPNIKLYADERFEILPIPRTPKGNKYAITNYGRAISYTTTPPEGRFLKPGTVSGYPSLSVRVGGVKKTFLIHRLVAEYFLRKPDRTYRFVIHFNNRKDDNHYQNLKWATFEQSQKHLQKHRKDARIGNYKLTDIKVMQIKKLIASGKNRLNIIAKRFGVTDMQIHRIKTGENWGHVKI